MNEVVAPSNSTGLYRRFCQSYDRFLFASCDARVCVVMRIAVGTLLLIYVAIWMRDATLWFTDEGIMKLTTARRLSSQPSLLYWLPSNTAVIQTCLAIMFAQCVMMLLGCWSRFQAACIFVWLLSFQTRNPVICDGEDTVLRWLVLYMIFMPLDYRWSLVRLLRRDAPEIDQLSSAWALRLVQFQITGIYISTVWSKFQGETWRNGTALYYVSRMDELFGRGYLPAWLFETPWIVQLSTWSVLAVELFLPIALWIRPLRHWAIALGILLHLSIEYAMNLFLFEWIMIAGLLAFIQLDKIPSLPFRRTIPRRLDTETLV